MKQKFKRQGTVTGIVLMLVMFFSSFSAIDLQAQERITGIITGSDGIPLPGVNVVQKGTKKGAVTDFDGKFTILLAPGGKTLVVSYLGFETQQVDVSNKTNVTVILKEDVEGLDEVVVIGYVAVEREKILGATTTVKAESIEKATPVTAFDAVQGKVSGVQILTNNGPGAGFDIRVRGITSFAGNNSPLYVVDGQQLEDIDNIDPSDIESLEILKDGATTAIYGSRGANGVVLITTKSGKAGELKFNISSITGYNTLVGDLRVSNANERNILDRARSTNPLALTNVERDSLSTLNRNSNDLQDLITRPAVRHSTNVALSGGTEKARFYWNTGFLNEEGIVRSSSYKRVNSNYKLDVKATKFLDVGTNLNFSFENRDGISESQAFNQIVQRIPTYPLFEPDGSFTRTLFGRANPLAIADLQVADNRSWRGRMFNYATLKITPKLSIKSTLGLNFRFDKLDDFTNSILTNPNAPQAATGRLRQNITYDIQQENFLNYTNKWNEHSLSAFGGMQIQRYFIERTDFEARFANDRIQTFNNAAISDESPINISRNNNQRYNLYSLFTGFSYDYKGKYLIGGTIRRDGSSRFGDQNEFGTFPSASIGWNLSKENFLKGNKLINNLLLRASYGEVGSQTLGNYEFTTTYSPGLIYNNQSGVAPTQIGNDELSWETTLSKNLGIDLAMLNSRLKINLDFWQRETEDILAEVPLPEETGFASIRQNIGSLKNRGFDVNINGTIIKSKDFTWKSNLNIGYLENEVTKLANGESFQDGAILIEEGQPLGNFFGFKNQGVYAYDESNAYTPDGVRLDPVVEDGQVVYNGTAPVYTLNGESYTGDVRQLSAAGRTLAGGDIIWQDLPNEDGEFDFVINNADRQVIGNGLGNVTGGFSHDIRYKNFSCSFLFDWSLNQDIYRRWDEQRNDFNAGGETPGPDRINGAWTQQGDVTVYPSLERTGRDQNRLAPNSFFVTDGSFVKWRYLRFNYDLSKKVIDKIPGVSSLSLNLAVNNVLTWTNYIGFNPELGNRGNSLQLNVDNLRYPNDRELILGLKLQLK